MKTLYYKMEMRVFQTMFNEGFLKVEIDEEQKIRMFGVLTDDVFTGEEKDGLIRFSYFVCNYEEECFDEIFEFSIESKYFQLPQSFELENKDGNRIQIDIEEKIQNQLKKEKCDRIIDKVIDVFENESE